MTEAIQIPLQTSAGELYGVQYIVNAAMPTIVFLHDSLGCITLWRNFPERLAVLTGCNALVYDRKGYGKSIPFSNKERNNDYLEQEADILAAILDNCNIEQAILFGHSDGGSIALIAAAKYPVHIKAIITEGAHIFVEEITLQGIRNAQHDWQTTNLKKKLEKYHGEKTEAVFHAWTNTWLSDEFRNWNIESFLPSVTCPVLIIQGEHDEFGSMEQVNGILNLVAGNAVSLIIPSATHTPHKEAIEIVLQKTASFIRQLFP